MEKVEKIVKRSTESEEGERKSMRLPWMSDESGVKYRAKLIELGHIQPDGVEYYENERPFSHPDAIARYKAHLVKHGLLKPKNRLVIRVKAAT